MAKRRRRNTIILVIVLTVISLIFIYPVFLMFLNSFKPFGEVVSDPIAQGSDTGKLYLCN